MYLYHEYNRASYSFIEPIQTIYSHRARVGTLF